MIAMNGRAYKREDSNWISSVHLNLNQRVGYSCHTPELVFVMEMRGFLVIFIAMATFHSSYGTLSTENDPNWALFKQKFNKTYSSEKQPNRYAIFLNNSAFIEQINSQNLSYTVEVNAFADLTFDEFKAMYLGARPPQGELQNILNFSSLSAALPPSFDWRSKGYVTPVKDQSYPRKCGSCWAFSATGALEGQHKKSTGVLVSLSEQNLVDCSRNGGNSGCNGGWPSNAFNYVRDNRGIDTEASYPYTGQQDVCRFKATSVGARCSGYNTVQPNSERSMQYAVAKIGPISVGIHVTRNFHMYKKGVFYDPICSSDPKEANHAVLIVGYGTSSAGQDYWIVKNSWGTRWGQLGGYIWMARNHNNMCGILNYGTYPTGVRSELGDQNTRSSSTTARPLENTSASTVPAAYNALVFIFSLIMLILF